MKNNGIAESISSSCKKPPIFWRIHDKILDVSVATCLCSILALMFLQITARYVFQSPLRWSEEVIRYAQVYLTFLGSVVLVREKALISIDAIVNFFPNKLRKILWVFTTILSFIFLVFLVIYGYNYVMSNINVFSFVTGVRMGYLYSVIPISGVLMILNMVRKLKEAPEWNY